MIALQKKNEELRYDYFGNLGDYQHTFANFGNISESQSHIKMLQNIHDTCNDPMFVFGIAGDGAVQLLYVLVYGIAYSFQTRLIDIPLSLPSDVTELPKIPNASCMLVITEIIKIT